MRTGCSPRSGSGRRSPGRPGPGAGRSCPAAAPPRRWSERAGWRGRADGAGAGAGPPGRCGVMQASARRGRPATRPRAGATSQDGDRAIRWTRRDGDRGGGGQLPTQGRGRVRVSPAAGSARPPWSRHERGAARRHLGIGEEVRSMGVSKTRAAVLLEPQGRWEIRELDLDPPKANEVLVRVMATGLCHSDEHVRSSATRTRLPMVGGHEGSGIVEEVGPGVTRVAKGDHIVTSFIPVCGRCRYCSTGRQNLCDDGKNAQTGALLDGTYRFHLDGKDAGGMCVLGTFSQYMVISENSCVKVDDDIPFDVACLVGCGVTTGWGSAVYAAKVRPGDTVVVFGVGGVGINAVQGARYAGAKHVIAIDPVEFKLEMAQVCGATHVFRDPEAAKEEVIRLTRGQLADHCILTVGVMTEEVVTQGFDMIGKDCQLTITGIGYGLTVHLPGAPMAGWQKRVQGVCFGAANPLYDIPKLLDLYRAGDLKLDELITRRYRLEEINQCYQDLLDGKNIRGVVIHEH